MSDSHWFVKNHRIKSFWFDIEVDPVRTPNFYWKSRLHSQAMSFALIRTTIRHSGTGALAKRKHASERGPCGFCCQHLLTQIFFHWGQNKVIDTLQATFSNAYFVTENVWIVFRILLEFVYSSRIDNKITNHYLHPVHQRIYVSRGLIMFYKVCINASIHKYKDIISANYIDEVKITMTS